MPYIFTYLIKIIPLIVLSVVGFSHAAPLQVDASKTYQSIDGFGACSAWLGDKITADHATLFWADDAINGHIGLSILRTRIDPSGYTVGEAGPMKKAKKVNPNIRIWSTSWTPPAQFKDNGSLTGGHFKSDSASMQGFADHLVKYVQDVKKNDSIDLYAVSCQNEPDTAGDWDGCAWTGEQLRVFVRDYWGPACVNAGITARRMIGESIRNNLALTDPSLRDTASARYVDIIGAKLYEGGPFPYPLSDSLHKSYWETEICGLKAADTSIANAVMLANQVHDCIVRCNMNAYHYWWLVNSNANDDEGLCNAKGLPTPRMFALGNFSKFIRPGFVRVAATDTPAAGIKASAYYGPSSNSLVVVAINSGAATNLEITVSGVPERKSAVPWLTDSTHRLERLHAAALSNNAFSYTLPSKSVVTFVLLEAARAFGLKNETSRPSMRMLRSGAARLIEIPSAATPRTIQLVSPSGRELMRKRVPAGRRSVVVVEPRLSGVVLVKTQQDGVVRTLPLLLTP
jgi:glucuronoarabinoxylan endo-1,4-beta-xylanase